MVIELVADLFGTFGMLGFLVAEIFQLKKILRTKKASDLSKTAYRNKMIAIILTCICFGLTKLFLSFTVLFLEGIVVGKIMLLMRKWKK